MDRFDPAGLIAAAKQVVEAWRTTGQIRYSVGQLAAEVAFAESFDALSQPAVAGARTVEYQCSACDAPPSVSGCKWSECPHDVTMISRTAEPSQPVAGAVDEREPEPTDADVNAIIALVKDVRNYDKANAAKVRRCILTLYTHNVFMKNDVRDLIIDRDEWKTQHENLLAMYQTQTSDLVALRTASSSQPAAKGDDQFTLSVLLSVATILEKKMDGDPTNQDAQALGYLIMGQHKRVVSALRASPADDGGKVWSTNDITDADMRSAEGGLGTKP